MRSAFYESQHLKHHRALGTAGDNEIYKQGIHTRFRRLLFASPALLIYRSLFRLPLATQQQSPAGEPERPIALTVHGGAKRLRWERNTRYALWILAVGSTAWDWRFLVFGYLLPFAIVTPVVNTVRIVLEHFDLDRNNPLWVGTFYRTGLLTRLVFFWGAGDCHLVHHYYANVPFYRMPAALRMMRPILLREGVYEHRSLPRLLWQWFSASRPHWSVPPEGCRGNTAVAVDSNPVV
jgi:fatty acid desaturase